MAQGKGIHEMSDAKETRAARRRKRAEHDAEIKAIKARHARIDKIADHLRRLEFPRISWEPGTDPVLDKIDSEAKKLLNLVEKRAAAIVKAFDAAGERLQAEDDAEWERREMARFDALKSAGFIPAGITRSRLPAK